MDGRTEVPVPSRGDHKTIETDFSVSRLAIIGSMYTVTGVIPYNQRVQRLAHAQGEVMRPGWGVGKPIYCRTQRRHDDGSARSNRSRCSEL